MISPALVLGASFGYLLLLFTVAAFGDRRARQGRSVIDNATIYALSWGVFCTAWTYFGSVGRAASSGVWFLPIYLGPTLAMLLAWIVLRKIVRIARTYRITSIADFIASRYGKSPLLAALVTLITVVGIVPYIALQLKAVSAGYQVLTGEPASAPVSTWWTDGTLYVALALAAFAIVFGTRHLDLAERHEGMVAAIAFESAVKLVAFLAVGAFVTWGLFDGMADIWARAQAVPELQALLRLNQSGAAFDYAQWFALTILSALAVLLLPRQFQVMVVECVDERHIRRAAWLFPAYLLLINVFVLPIAIGGLLDLRPGAGQPRDLRPVAAARPGRPGAGALRLHRRPLGVDRHAHRRDRGGLDHGLQRPRHADAAAPRPLRRPRGRRPDAAPAQHPPHRHRRGADARLPLLPRRRRGLRPRLDRPHQLRRRRPVRPRAPRRHLLARRHRRRRLRRPRSAASPSGPTR